MIHGKYETELNAVINHFLFSAYERNATNDVG